MNRNYAYITNTNYTMATVKKRKLTAVEDFIMEFYLDNKCKTDQKYIIEIFNWHGEILEFKYYTCNEQWENPEQLDKLTYYTIKATSIRRRLVPIAILDKIK